MSFARRIWQKQDPILLAILFCGLLLKAGYLIYYHSLPDWDQLSVDNYYHHHWAQSLAGGNLLGGTTYFRAPLYVYCLGALYALFGDSLWVGRLFGLSVGLASVVMTYAVAKRVFDRRTGLMAASLQILCPILIYYEGELLLDSFFCLLVQICIYRVLVWREHASSRNALWVGITLGLAAIARPTAIALLPVILLVLVWVVKKRGAVLSQIGLVAAGMALLIGPIFIRNIAVAGDPVVIASQGGINFYIGNNPSADGLSATLPEPLGFNWRIADITAIAEQSAGRELKPGEVSSYWTAQTWHWIGRNPGEALRLFGRKLYFSFADAEISNNKDLNAVFGQLVFFRFNPLSFAPIFGLACIGLFVGLRRNSGVQVLALCALSIVLLNALFFINSRFRLPVLVLLIVLAGAGLLSIVGRIRMRRWRTALVLVVAAVAIASLSRANIISLPHGTPAQWLNSKMLYYIATHDDRQALAFGRLAEKADGTFPDVNLNLGNIWLREGNRDSAEYYYRREASTNPQRPKAYINLASMYLLQHSLDSSSALAATALKLQPRDPTANTLAIRLASQLMLPPDSLQRVIDSAIKRSRADLRVLTEAASAFVQRDLLAAAEPVIERGMQAVPPAIETDDAAFDRDFIDSPERFNLRKSTIYYLAGYVYGRTGRFEDAVRCSREALARDSNLVEAYVNLVSGYFSLGRPTEADSTLTQALTRFPRNENLRRLQAAAQKIKRDR